MTDNLKLTVVERAVGLIVREAADRDQQFALACQWIDFKNEPILLDKPERLLSADDKSEFRHIALHLLRPGDDVTDLVMRFQKRDARGVILVHTSDEMPIEGLNVGPCENVKIPVVLIARKLGEGLLSELQEFFHEVYVSSFCESFTVPEYQPPAARKAADQAAIQAASAGETQQTAGFRSTGKKFRLKKQMQDLLFDGTSMPVVMCTDFERFRKTYLLLDDYEQHIYRRNATKSKIEKAIGKICDQLIRCMEKNYLHDFPYHCLMVWRILWLPTFRDAKAALSYKQSCEERLRCLSCQSLETAFVPFVKKNLLLPFYGKQTCACGLLHQFLMNVYESRRVEKKSAASNHIESFGVCLIAAEMAMVLPVLPEQYPRPAITWSSLVMKLDISYLPWSQKLLDEMKCQLDLAPYMGLPAHYRFNFSTLICFIQHYKLVSFEQIRQTIVTLYRSLPVESLSIGRMRSYISTIVEAEPSNSLVPYSTAGDLPGFVAEARDLILTLKDIHEYVCNSEKNGFSDEGSVNKTSLSSSHFEREIAKWIELILMKSPFLRICNPEWAQQVLTFKRGVLSPLLDIITQTVTELVARSLQTLELYLIYEIFKKLVFIPKKVLGEFLRTYKPRSSDRLTDVVWQNLFTLIVERDWKLLKSDIVILLKSMAQNASTRLQFFEDLLHLAQCKCCLDLFSCEDSQLLDNLRMFLVDYLKNTRSHLRLRSLLNQLGFVVESAVPLRDALLDVFFEVVVPSPSEFLMHQQPPIVKQFLGDLERELKLLGDETGKSPLPKCGISSRTCWQLLVECCRRVPPSQLTLTNPPNLKVLANIIRCFPSFWPLNQSSTTVECIETNPEAVFTEEMQEYGLWYFAVRQWLCDVQQQILDGEMALGELTNFKQNYDRVKQMFDSFLGISFCIEIQDIDTLFEQFNSMAETLISFVLYETSDHKWEKMSDLLVSWGVEINKELFQLVEESLQFSNFHSGMAEGNVLSGSLSFKPHVSQSDVFSIYDKVCSWFEVISANKNLLCYFSVHGSVLFQAYLEKQVTQFLECSQSMQSDAICRTSAISQDSVVVSSFFGHDLDTIDFKSDDQLVRHTVSLQEFNEGLHTVRCCLIKLLDQTARFQDVSIIEQKRFHGMDVGREVTTLLEYSEFRDMYDLESVQSGISDMLSLVQYASVVQIVVSVCEQYHMQYCLSAPEFIELKEYGEKLQNSSRMNKLTVAESSELKKKLDCLFMNTPVNRLHAFETVQQSEAFFKFICDNRFYTKEGKISFNQQVGLITNQLKDQEYNETVLSHLQVAFRFVVLFTDPQVTFTHLLEKLKESDVFNSSNWMHPMRTVNTNITTIKLWFSKAEGDTLENVTRDLEAIMTSGFYEFNLGVDASKGTSTSLLTSSSCDECGLQLVYTLQSESVTEAPNLAGQANDVMKSLSHCLPKSREHAFGEEANASEKVKGIDQFHMEAASCPKKFSSDEVHNVSKVVKQEVRLHGEDLDDFVLKLGFMQGEGGDQQQLQMREFLKKNELVRNMFDVCSHLRRLGDPNYRDKQIQCRVALSLRETEEQLVKYQVDLKTWQQSVSDWQKSYKHLLFFNTRQILALAKELTGENFAEVANLVSALFKSNKDSVEVLQAKIPLHYKLIKEGYLSILPSITCSGCVSPFQLCGKFLRALVEDNDVVTCLCSSSETFTESVSHTVHKAYSFSSDQIVRLLFQIYQGPPEPFEVLRCTAKTTEEECSRFLQRASNFLYRTFVMVYVNHLRTDLQEQVLRFQLDSSNQSVQMHYILDGHSICHDAPWINVEHYGDDTLKLSQVDVSKICQERVLNLFGISRIDLVFGKAGDGKSHYIKKQMKLLHGNTCTIAVHQAFSVGKAIQKLQCMKPQGHLKSNCIYFNITISPPSCAESEEVGCYHSVMNEFHWFLYDLLVMGFVQDSVTGQSFRLNAGFNWHFLVEVPSLPGEQDTRAGLSQFYALVPLLNYVGSEHYVRHDDPLDINDDVQLVCKYLRALKNPEHINRLYRHKCEVKFSTDPDLDDEACWQLLWEAMEDHVKNRKILQQLFVKYMKRRCDALENMPGFNYNAGRGIAIDKKSGKSKRVDRSELGSTLLSTMLREVNSFCNPDFQDDWKLHSHQQLIYDFKDCHSTILFLSINPEKLDRDEREKLEKVGIEIPSITELQKRELLDDYLSSALNVDQEIYPIAPDGFKHGLAQIDEAKYVLTVDYAVKMLSIHERRMCGVPVVIEGETGVGKTALLQMLSLLWNQSSLRLRRIALESVADILQKRVGAGSLSDDGQAQYHLEDAQSANHVISCIENRTEKTLERESIKKACSVSVEDIRKVLLRAVVDPFVCMFDIDRTLITESEDHNTFMHTARLLEGFLKMNVVNTFHKLNVHAALIPEDFINFFTPIFRQAEELQQLAKQLNREQPPMVIVFLDEINTSSCMGIVKELLVDRSLDGISVPSNIFLVAACNPHRGSSVVLRHSSERDDWVLGSYYVRPLSPTLCFLVWDYGALNENQERDYIREKFTMNRGQSNLQVSNYTDLIAKCQFIVREFAKEQLRSVGFTSEEAGIRATSCVSQRDIQRVFTLTGYFENSFGDHFNHQSSNWRARAAILVSLGIVYYLRLDEKYRKKFASKLNQLEAGTSEDNFSSVFDYVMDSYVDQMYIPVGIAKTRALKENLFAIVVCTSCCLPLIIVGPPGCSKTLSFNLALVNMKGAESRKPFFRNTKHFPILDPYHYQCSRRSTSLEIENVFKRAIKRQKHHNTSELPIRCVVFMDEAGLPEESHESLKVLHYYLDDSQVSFVAITNHILDASKSNRAVNLFRSQPDENDLKTLARGCFCSDPSQPLPEVQNIVAALDKFCIAYGIIMENQKFKQFYGLRDFIHFISYIRRHRGTATELTPDLVLKALERNFSGMGQENFRLIATKFLEAIDFSLDGVKQRNTIEVLQESLADVSLAQSGENEAIEAEVRYKLIIDMSDDDSMVRLLFKHHVLDQSSTRTFTCSNFCDDGDIQKVHIISAIKHAALEGRTVVLRQTDDINESFYDLFNQHFRRIDDPKFEGGRRYYANIAIGSHSKPCRVSPNFQCIVHVRHSEVDDIPSPFLNRFEKFLVSQEDLLQIAKSALPPVVDQLMSLAMDKGKSFYDAIGQENFYGSTIQTLQSLFLELLPLPTGKQRQFDQCLQAVLESDKCLDDNHSGNHDENDNNDEEERGRRESLYTMCKTAWNEKAAEIIESLEGVLREALGFQFSARSKQQRQFQCNAIFAAVLQLFDERDGIACQQELINNPKIIQSWLAKGFLDLFQGTAHSTSVLASWQRAKNVVSRNFSFAIATFVQWVVFHVCSSLLKIATPESLILQSGKIPQQYVLEYLDVQSHFSLKKVVRSCRDPDVATGFASKVICFTRTTAAVQKLPPSFPQNGTANDESFSVQIMEQLLPDGMTNGLVMVKLENIRTSEAFTNSLREFIQNSSRDVFLIIANMNICDRKRINHVRAMIEECELILTVETNPISNAKKTFILLLHFPPGRGSSKACYPTLFLHGWEHIYLDSIFEVDHTDPVNVCHWMRVRFVSHGQQKVTNGDFYVSEQFEFFVQRLKEDLLQHLPQAIDIAVARVKFGDVEGCHLNRKMNARKRAETLQTLLNKFHVLSEVLCERFAKVWNLDAIGEQLMMATDSDSCLTVSERVQSRFRTLFYNYISLSLWKLNKDYNVELLFESVESNDEEIALKKLFVDIFRIVPIPRLNELCLLNHTFDARQHSVLPVFPFFNLVAQEMQQAIDHILVAIHEEVGINLDKEQMEDERQLETKCAKLCDIETTATLQLLETLQSPTSTGSFAVAQLAYQAIDGDETLWDRYLAEFARVKLHCNLGNHGSREHCLLIAWLGGLERRSAKERFAALHIIARFHQKRISSIIAALRLLKSMETLRSEIKLSGAFLNITSSGQEVEGQLYVYIIDVMYGYLQKLLSSSLLVEDALSGTEESFKTWYFVYQNLAVSLPALTVYQFKDNVRSKLRVIHIVFIFMKALNLDQSAAIAGALNLAQEVSCNVQSLTLGDIVKKCLSYLCQVYQFEENETLQSDTDALFAAKSALLEDILIFHFPSVPPDRGLFCSLPDCRWLLNMINRQHHWIVKAVGQARDTLHTESISLPQKESVSGGYDFPVESVHFKVAQHCLMQTLQSTVKNNNKLDFNSQIREMVGEVLCGHSIEMVTETFIPVCYSRSANFGSQQPLASVYFHCCLDRLNATTGDAGFTYLLQLIDQYDEDISSSRHLSVAVLQVERQAAIQVIIRKFSEMFEPGNVELLKPYLDIHVTSRVNHLFEDERWGGGKGSGHVLAFLHHLSQRLKSTRNMISIFTDHFGTFCRPFPWMLDISNKLEEQVNFQSHLLPFMLDDGSDETFQSRLYKQVTDLVDAISIAVLAKDTEAEADAVDKLCDFCKSESCQGKGNSLHLRMMLCLAIYYQLYEKKISSNCLAEKVFLLKCIDLEEKKCSLLACFAAPKNMVCCSELSNPINADEVRLELHGANVRRRINRDQDVEETDPLWDLFCPTKIDTQDSSDIDLRRSLALLAAVAVALPADSTHIWTHVFEPEAIEGTFVTGNLYPNAVKRDGLLYDCGCELTADGEYGRPDYAAHADRGTLNLHSLYLLLWINFGSFCLSLLTQRDAQHTIKGGVISDWQSVRHYCLSQVKTMWMLIRDNLHLSDEDRTLFVISAVQKFYEVAQRTHSLLSGSLFSNLDHLDLYERAFHEEVFHSTWQMFHEDKFVNQSVWQQCPLLTSIRQFSATYPVEPTYKDFIHSLEQTQGTTSARSHQELSVLRKFIREKDRLRIGGLLLPDLVEFYVWLHQQLSHLVTMEQALELSVGDVVERLTKRYSKDYAVYIQRLFARVEENYNKFFELNGGVIGQGPCLRVHQENNLQPLNRKETKLAQLLSDTIEEEDGPDALFLVIRTLVATQNYFISAVKTNDHLCTSLTAKVLSPREEVSALELGFHNCLMGDVTAEDLQAYLRKEVDQLSDKPGAELMRIIRRHYLYVPGARITAEAETPANLTASLLTKYKIKSSMMFDFHRLQQDVVTQFIAGKPFIIDPAQIRVIFHYRQTQSVELHPSLRSVDNIEAHIDLPTLEHELPQPFKSQLSVSRKKEIDIIFHNMNYRNSVDLIKALRAVASRLRQALMEAEVNDQEALSAKCDELSQLTICNFLVEQVYNEYNWSPELGSRIGFPFLLADSQRDHLLHTSMSQLYDTVVVFSSKLCDKEYEFAHLPLTLKIPLSESVIEAINKLPEVYAERGKTSEIVEHMKVLDQTLLHSEHDLEQQAKESSMVNYLVETGFYGDSELPVCLLPKDVRIEHYMHLRLAIKRVLAVREDLPDCADDRHCWSDVVVSMLEKFPQMDHRPNSKSASEVLQVPVIVLGGNGGLHHPLWFESKSSSSEEESELEEELDDVSKSMVPTLQPLLSSQLDYELPDSNLSMSDKDEDNLKPLELSGFSSNESAGEISEDEPTVDRVGVPIPGSQLDTRDLLSEAASISNRLSAESTAATGTVKFTLADV